MSHVVALCPTYRRRRLVNNAIALFFRQTWSEPMTMLVFDDGENALLNFLYHENKTVMVIPFTERFPTLGAKYNSLVDYACDKLRADYLFIWEDDDIYLPDHIEKYMKCFQAGAQWVKPSLIYTYFGERLEKVDPHFSFFASIAFTKSVRDQTDPVYFIEDHVVQFDIDFMHKLSRKYGSPHDPIEDGEPTYVFRWDTTEAYHGQGFMHLGDRWYEAVPYATQPEPAMPNRPVLDEDSIRVLRLTREQRNEDSFGCLSGKENKVQT